MENKIDQIMQAYVNKSYDELLASAKSSLGRLMPFFQSIDKDAGSKYVMHFMATALAVDDKFTRLEYNYFCDLFDIHESYEEVKNFIADFDSYEAIALADHVFDSIPNNDVKSDLLNLFLCTVSIDEHISREEYALFRVLID